MYTCTLGNMLPYTSSYNSRRGGVSEKSQMYTCTLGNMLPYTSSSYDRGRQREEPHVHMYTCAAQLSCVA